MCRIWERRPWSFKGEHLILKKYNPTWSFTEIDFSVSDFWIQIHGLPFDRHNIANAQKIGKMVGPVLEEDISGGGVEGARKFIRVRGGGWMLPVLYLQGFL